MTLGLRQVFFYYKSDEAFRNVFNTKQYICIKHNECTWTFVVRLKIGEEWGKGNFDTDGCNSQALLT